MKTSLSFHLFIIVLASQQRTSAAQTVCGSHGEVRLANGYKPGEGYVEVCLNGVWMLVCDSKWNDMDAGVVCRQLGFPATEARSTGGTFFGANSADEYPGISDVECTGNETGLINCTHTVESNCGHSNIAGVICIYNGVTGMFYNGQAFQNNSVINAEVIDTSVSTYIRDTIVCLTSRRPCCGEEDGSWYNPGGSRLSVNVNPGSFFQTYNSSRQVVILYRSVSAGTSREGLFLCQILDEADMVQNMYIGIYSSGTGAPIVSSLSYERSSQTVICTSTGGPAASVTWSKDNVTLSVDGTTFQHSQVITDISTATYENRLRIVHENQESYGVYTCTVSNLMGTDSSHELAVGACDDGDALIASNGAVIRLCYNMTWHNVAVTPTQSIGAETARNNGPTQQIITTRTSAAGQGTIWTAVLGSLFGASFVALGIVIAVSVLVIYLILNKRKNDRSNSIPLRENTNAYTLDGADAEHMVSNSLYGVSVEMPPAPALSENVAYNSVAYNTVGFRSEDANGYETIDLGENIDNGSESIDAVPVVHGYSQLGSPGVPTSPPSIPARDDQNQDLVKNREYDKIGTSSCQDRYSHLEF